tara:strand:+ start:224 stop:955 length:732 start_codon:yes stop_codon:yes gene_type:complete
VSSITVGARSFDAHLGAGVVQFWTHRFQTDTEVVHNSYRLLSSDERDRADRFFQPEIRNRFILARAGLRRLLAWHLGTNPQEVAFAYGEYGKPHLDKSDLSFNMSHSGEMAIYVVSHGRKVGVDVEFVGRKVSRDQIAGRFFASEEVAALEAMPERERDRGFFTIWTLKEAYLKAQGTGITNALDSFAVRVEGHSQKLLRADDDPDASEKWKIVSVDICVDYVAAVCGEGKNWQIEYCKWPRS